MGNLLYWAIVFLIIALIAAFLGFGGVAGVATEGARLLFWVAIILVVLSFIGGVLNVECHYTFGFPPTAYESGTALAYNGTTGVVIDPNPAPPGGWIGADPIDWSSGMPLGLKTSVARLAANRILRQVWRGVSNGLSSVSVDGASESYGSKAFGGDLDDEDKTIMNGIVAQYGISFL